MKRPVLALLLLAALTSAAHAWSPAPDYHAYQELLDRFLVRVGPKGGPVDTRFDYEQLYMDERIFARHMSDRLTAAHSAIFSVEPADLAPADRQAWGINAYNFLVLERATLNLLVPDRGFQRYKSVETMLAVDGPFFTSPYIKLPGRSMSLDTFRRLYVYADSTAANEPRRKPADPRVSFAICSGHAGDPPLWPRVFRGDSLEAQLDGATRAALALPRMARMGKGGVTLLLADPFPAPLVDFGGSREAMFAFVEKYVPSAIRKAMRKTWVKGDAAHLPFDNDLNQYDRPKPRAPGAGGDKESATTD